MYCTDCSADGRKRDDLIGLAYSAVVETMVNAGAQAFSVGRSDHPAEVWQADAEGVLRQVSAD